MQFIDNIIFLICLIVGVGLFYRGLNKIYRNIMLGKSINRFDNISKRWKLMAKIALGQGKMTTRPIAGILHILVYAGFLIINLELLEIIIDGIFGTHRFLKNIIGNGIYNGFTAVLEIMALLVLVSVIAFFIRRNFIKINRLNMEELRGWAKKDANWILVIETSLMLAFLLINSAEFIVYSNGVYPISKISIVPILKFFELSNENLIFIERVAWWYHFIGILFFMNYLFYSKHLHIVLAFPNTWFAKLEPKGQLDNLDSITKEVKLMLDPNADPYAIPADTNATPEKFGANDIFDLNKIQLLNAYSCTECGRCTAVCPANITGKALSPRKIMMKTRDRIEEVGKNINRNGSFVDDNKNLLDDYITREELRACVTCNACTDACPILIDPVSIIIDLRRFMIMEESSAPQEWNMMISNIENNGAPWQYNQADRLNWADED